MGHLQTRKNLSRQGKTFPDKEKPFQTRKTPSNKENTNKQRKNLSKQGKHQQTKETPFNKQEKYFSGKEMPFKQGVSSDQM